MVDIINFNKHFQNLTNYVWVHNVRKTRCIVYIEVIIGNGL